MKKSIFYFVTILFCISSFKMEEVDIYSVIKVIGGINHLENGKALFSGDKVRSNEKLKFITPESKAAVISSKKGRFILANNNTENLGLMPAMNNVSSRAGALINMIDLQKHFQGNYLMLPNYNVEISENSFPMNADNFFFLRFNFKEEQISKKLDFEGNKLSIDKNEILKIDGNVIELEEKEQMSLYYRNSKENTSTLIAEFTPIFAEEEVLKMEIKIILNEFSNKNSEEQKNEITAYLNENYGKPHKDNLDQWLKQNFNLE